MPQYVIDTLKPKNNNNFPVAEAVDVLYEEGSTVKDKIIAINALIVAAQQLIEGVQTDISELQSGKVDKVSGKGLSTNDFTNTYKSKVDNTYTKTETDTAFAGKVDKVSGKGLSTNDFTNTYKNKVDNTYTKTETDSAIANKIAEVVAEAPESFDTLKEIADWINTHADSASAMNSAIQANAANIEKKVDKVEGKELSTNDFTTAYKDKVDNTYTKTETDTALAGKVDKVNGKGLSTNDFTTAYKDKIDDTYTKSESDSITSAISTRVAENESDIAQLQTDVASKASISALTETNNTVAAYKANLQSQIDTLVVESVGDGNAEVVQARVGVDGTNYSTLKSRLDDMENEINSVEIGSIKTNEYNMFRFFNIQKNKYITGYSTTTFKPLTATDTSSNESERRFIVDFEIPPHIKKAKVKFPSGPVSNQMLILYKENKKAFNRTYSQLNATWSGNGISRVSGDDFYTMNFNQIIANGYDHVCFVGLMSDLSSMYMDCDGVSFDWLNIPNPNGYEELQLDVSTLNKEVEKNKDISRINLNTYDMFKTDIVTIQENKYIPSVNTTTRLPDINDDGSNTRFVVTFNVPENIKKSKVKFPSGTVSNQMIVVTTTTSFNNYTYAQISAGYNGMGISYTVGNDYYEFDFDKMREYNVVSVAFVGLKVDLPNMYMECSGVDINWLNTGSTGGSLEHVDIVVPPRIYGVVGMETNVYFDNLLYASRIGNVAKVVVKQPDSTYGDTQCYELSDRLVWNPTTAVSVSKKAQLYRYTTDTVSVEKTTQFVATAATAGSKRSKKVLIIGDSKIDNGILTPYLYQDGVEDENLSITCVGTRGPENGKHEGRSGWKAETYCTKASFNNRDNAFYNNSTFDFSYYMQNSGVEVPDYVFINLGTNDSATDGYDAETFISYLNTMIDSIKNYNSSIIVCVGMCEGTCTTTTDYHYEWNDNIQLYHKALITEFKDRENEKIFLCPLYVSMDLANDYSATEVPLSKRDGTLSTGKTREQVTDHLHQNRVGYYKNADMMYCLIKYIENLIDNNSLTV